MGQTEPRLVSGLSLKVHVGNEKGFTGKRVTTGTTRKSRPDSAAREFGPR